MRVGPILIKRRTLGHISQIPVRLFSYDLTRTQALKVRDWINKVIEKNDKEGWK